MMLMIDAHKLLKVHFLHNVTCLEVCDGICHIEGDESYDLDSFPVSDLISVVEEDD